MNGAGTENTDAVRFFYGEEAKGKLVRDKLETVILGENHGVKSRKLKKDELISAIIDKQAEETSELIEAIKLGSRDEVIEELADLKSLFNSLLHALKISKDEVDEAERVKSEKKGSFYEGAFIEYVDLNPIGVDYDLWLKYFRSNSDRYKEIEA